jgi:hypothetical protein
MTPSARERVKRLRDLIHRLEQLPASAERDRVLAEVRARAVDVDTGETPRAMLEEDPLPSSLLLPLQIRRAGAAPRPPRAPRRPPPSAPPRAPLEPLPREPAEVIPISFDPAERVHLLWDDDPSPVEDSPPGHALHPWRRGLRG